MATATPTVSVPPTRCAEEKERDESRKHHMVEGEMLESNNDCECDDDDGGRGLGGGDGIASGAEHPNAPPPTPKVHPLEQSWTFWFDDSSVYKYKQIPWGSAIRPIHTFSTVEDFWGSQSQTFIHFFSLYIHLSINIHTYMACLWHF